MIINSVACVKKFEKNVKKLTLGTERVKEIYRYFKVYFFSDCFVLRSIFVFRPILLGLFVFHPICFSGLFVFRNVFFQAYLFSGLFIFRSFFRPIYSDLLFSVTIFLDLFIFKAYLFP